MQTHNRYMNIIAIVIAAACLSLAAACGSDGTEYAYGDRITPSAPCGPDIPLTTSIEYITLEGANVPSRLEKALEAAQNPHLIDIEDAEGREMFIGHITGTARAERLRPETERIKGILDKYEDQIWRQINTHDVPIVGFGVSSVKNENGELTDKQVILITVSEYVDQGTLPSEDRIPQCMDGVEVHFEIVPEPGDYLPDYAR